MTQEMKKITIHEYEYAIIDAETADELAKFTRYSSRLSKQDKLEALLEAGVAGSIRLRKIRNVQMEIDIETLLMNATIKKTFEREVK